MLYSLTKQYAKQVINEDGKVCKLFLNVASNLFQGTPFLNPGRWR